MENHSIVRFVNYFNPSLARAKRLSEYLKNLSRTDPRYISAHYMSKTHCEHSLKIVENRWHPKGNRTFKQGILSFGASVDELPPERALEIANDAMGYFDEYPWLVAIHTNKPQHIHAHFMLGMTNIKTGKKYSQSPKDLKSFRAHYNTIALKNNLPLLKGEDLGMECDKTNKERWPSNVFDENIQATDVLAPFLAPPAMINSVKSTSDCPFYHSYPPNRTTNGRMIGSQDCLITFLEMFRDDFINSINLGYEKER